MYIFFGRTLGFLSFGFTMLDSATLSEGYINWIGLLLSGLLLGFGFKMAKGGISGYGVYGLSLMS